MGTSFPVTRLSFSQTPPLGRGGGPAWPGCMLGAAPLFCLGPWPPKEAAARAPIQGGSAQSWLYPRVQAGASRSPWRTHVCSLHRHVQGGRGPLGLGAPHGDRRPAHSHLGLVLQAGLVPLLLHQGAGQRWQ